MRKEVRYDIRALLEAADPLSVAEFIGIDIKGSDLASGKKNAAILCPAHDDHHFGSCHLTNKGFVCYACGAKGDVIDMVCYHYGWDIHDKQHIKEALGIVGDSCGDRSRFQCLDNTEKAPIKKRLVWPLLAMDQLDLLGLGNGYSNGFANGVYIIVGSRYPGDDINRPLERGEYAMWCPLDNMVDADGTDEYELIMRCVDKNPLRTLAEEDPDSYKALILNKCKESIGFYENIIELVLNHDMSSELGRLCVKIVQDIGSHRLFIKACELRIREIEDILIEFGGKSNKDKEKAKNIFGKIKVSTSF